MGLTAGPTSARPPIAKELVQIGARQCSARVWKKRDGYDVEVLLSMRHGPGQPLTPSLMIFCYSCPSLDEIEQKLWEHAPRTGAEGAIVWKAIGKVLREGVRRRPAAAWPFPV